MPEEKPKTNGAEGHQESTLHVVTDPRERLRLLALRFPALAEKYGAALEEAARRAEEELHQAQEGEANGDNHAEEEKPSC